MHLPLIFTSLRLVLACYFLVLAVAALFGLHRVLMAYPFHATYAAVRILLLGLTFGRVRLAKDVRARQRREARRVRAIKTTIADWRERRTIAKGELDITKTSEWQSAHAVQSETIGVDIDAIDSENAEDDEVPPRLY